MENTSDLKVKSLRKTGSANEPPFNLCQESGQFGDDTFPPPISQCLNPPLSNLDSPPHSPLNATSPSNSRPSSSSHHLLTLPSQFISLSPLPKSNIDPLSLPEDPPSPSDISLPLHPDYPPTEHSDSISLSQFPSPPPSVPLFPSISLGPTLPLQNPPLVPGA